MPKETGMMFKGELVRAILEGRKTQTRRIVAMPRTRNSFVMLDYGKGWWPYQSDDGESELCNDGNEHPYNAPYGTKGDLIYVRETWAHGIHALAAEDARLGAEAFVYAADGAAAEQGRLGDRWKPAIHMPKYATRIWLEITGVRVEQLQDISTEDCIAEGLSTTLREYDAEVHLRDQFQELWESTGASWADNPWVWVYEFKRIDRPATA